MYLVIFRCTRDDVPHSLHPTLADAWATVIDLATGRSTGDLSDLATEYADTVYNMGDTSELLAIDVVPFSNGQPLASYRAWEADAADAKGGLQEMPEC